MRIHYEGSGKTLRVKFNTFLILLGLQRWDCSRSFRSFLLKGTNPMDCCMVLGGKLSWDETSRKKWLQQASHHAQSYAVVEWWLINYKENITAWTGAVRLITLMHFKQLNDGMNPVGSNNDNILELCLVQQNCAQWTLYPSTTVGAILPHHPPSSELEVVASSPGSYEQRWQVPTPFVWPPDQLIIQGMPQRPRQKKPSGEDS